MNDARIPTRILERELGRAMAAGVIATFRMEVRKGRRRFVVVMPDGSTREWEPAKALAFCEGVTEALEAAG